MLTGKQLKLILRSMRRIKKEKRKEGSAESREKIKAIGDMTEREKRAKRQYWREDNRKRAARLRQQR